MRRRDLSHILLSLAGYPSYFCIPYWVSCLESSPCQEERELRPDWE